MKLRDQFPRPRPEESSKKESHPTTEDERYYLTEKDRDLSEKDFIQKYQVSRATYYKAKRDGYFVPGYHTKRGRTAEREQKQKEEQKRKEKETHKLKRGVTARQLQDAGIPKSTSERIAGRGWIRLDEKRYSQEIIQAVESLIVPETEMSPEFWRNAEGEKKTFSHVVLGHLDTDTLSAYVIARDAGHINPDAKITIAQRTKKENLEKADTLTLEVAQIPTPNNEDLLQAKKTLESLGLPTTELERKMSLFSETNQDAYNAQIGNITHEGDQINTAAKQVFQLSGSNINHEALAEHLQEIEVTRNLRVRKNERIGPSYAQIVNQLIKKHRTGGRMTKEQTQELLDDCYELFQHIKTLDTELKFGIPVKGTPFNFVNDRLKKESEEQRELLKTISFLDSKTSINDIRIGLVDAGEAQRGVFGKINSLRDENERPLSEITVLKAAERDNGSHEVKIAIHKSLKGEISLEMLAKTLNAFEVARGTTTLEDDKFGGHYMQIIGSPRERGTTFSAEKIFEMVLEYADQYRYSEDELLDFADRAGLKGARMVFVPGLGKHGVPERAIEYTDTESTEISPELYRSGIYGDLRKVVRESQLELESNSILTPQAHITRLMAIRPEQALKYVQTLPKSEQEKVAYNLILGSTTLLENIEAIATLYTPERNDYLAIPADKLPPWVKSEKDKAASLFSHPESVGNMFEKKVLQTIYKGESKEQCAHVIKSFLEHPSIRDAFSDGEIYGSLDHYALSLATGIDVSTFKEREPINELILNEIPLSVSANMAEFISKKLSTTEIKRILQLIEKTGELVSDNARPRFENAVRPLLEQIGSRGDVEQLRNRELLPGAQIEVHTDTHSRQVVIIEIGRDADMKQAIAEMLQQQTGGEKQQANLTISRLGVIEDSSEESQIEQQAIQEIENLFLDKPEGSEIEIYIQGPATISANVAIAIGKAGIDARFGRWKDGQYVLT